MNFDDDFDIGLMWSKVSDGMLKDFKKELVAKYDIDTIDIYNNYRDTYEPIGLCSRKMDRDIQYKDFEKFEVEELEKVFEIQTEFVKHKINVFEGVTKLDDYAYNADTVVMLTEQIMIEGKVLTDLERIMDYRRKGNVVHDLDYILKCADKWEEEHPGETIE